MPCDADVAVQLQHGIVKAKEGDAKSGAHAFAAEKWRCRIRPPANCCGKEHNQGFGGFGLDIEVKFGPTQRNGCSWQIQRSFKKLL